MDEQWGLVIAGFFLGVFILALVLGASGVFDSSIKKLDIDKDNLARIHVLEYYPEYESCSIEYEIFEFGFFERDTDRVNIYCEEKDNRDGMRVVKESDPTIKIEFEDITLKEIFDNQIKEYK